jgi:glycosyltransferase involved in cell wall biosynthesis
MPDVLVAASPTLACAQALRFARRHSIPSVYISQTQAETLQPYMSRWLGASLAPALARSFTRLVYPAFAKVDAVVFPTSTARDLITQAGPESFRRVKSVVISNGVDTSSYCPSPEKAMGSRAAAPNFLFIGRLMRDKSPDMPVRALADVRSRGVQATLTVVGGGPLEGSLKRLAAELGIEEHVRFTGFLPEELVIAHLREATATIIPSFAETQSLVLLESIACGTPVLCADAPANAASAFIRSHECGDLYRYDDSGSLAEALLRLVRNRKRYRELCGNCLGVRDRFSLDSVTAQWLDLCRALRAEKCHADSGAASLWPASHRLRMKDFGRKGAMGI